MAAFTSVIPAQRYCQSDECRNGIRLNIQDKLCEQCAAADKSGSGSVSEPSKLEMGDDGSSCWQPSRPTELGEPAGEETREDRNGDPLHHAFSPPPVEAQTDPFAAHLAMLDERQQNRARKLDRETEEMDGRWRTKSSAPALMGSSPPRLSRSRNPEVDRAVMVDDSRSTGRYRAHVIDTYRSSRSSPVLALRSDAAKRVHETTSLRVLEPEAEQITDDTGITFRSTNKRKLEDETAGSNASSKTLVKPSESARCGKRDCNNKAKIGKDRCKPCYYAEGQHVGDERRRCASKNCRNCISDAIKGDLCRPCLDIELGDIKPRICSRPLCANISQTAPETLCSECKLQSIPVRQCKADGCSKVLLPIERGGRCKEHNPASKTTPRICSKLLCKNQIAANILGDICRICLTRNADGKKQPVKKPTRASRYQSRMPVHGASSAYQQYPYDYYRPSQEFPTRPYQQDFQGHEHQQSFHHQPYQHIYQDRSPFHQPQQITDHRPFQVPPQQFPYYPQQLMMSPHGFPQQPGRQFSHPDQMRHIDGHRSSLKTQSFLQDTRPQVSGPPARHFASPSTSPRLSFVDTQRFNSLPDVKLSLSQISSSARRTRVMTVQRMLKAPCLDCLQNLGEEEASTHPQIYCVHLPSAMRQMALSDHDQWKQMCASGQEAEDGEIDSEVEMAEDVGQKMTTMTNDEKQREESMSRGSMRFGLQRRVQCQTTPATLPTGVQQQLQTRHDQETTESFVPDDDSRGSKLNAPGFHEDIALPAHPTKTKSDAVPNVQEPYKATPPPRGDSNVLGGDLPTNWAAVSIQELLELKSAAEPGTQVEIAVALQQELRNCLLLDVTQGNPQDGEPSAIALLRVLDQRIETLQAKPCEE